MIKFFTETSLAMETLQYLGMKEYNSLFAALGGNKKVTQVLMSFTSIYDIYSKELFSKFLADQELYAYHYHQDTESHASRVPLSKLNPLRKAPYSCSTCGRIKINYGTILTSTLTTFPLHVPSCLVCLIAYSLY